MNYLDLCIHATNKLHKRESKWISSEIHKLGVAFVLQKLEHQEFAQPTLAVEDNGSTWADWNKITWSEMFVRQPRVQRMLDSFLTELNRLLNVEMTYNKRQLRSYLRYPRSTQGKGKDQGLTQGAARGLSYTQEKNQMLNDRQAYFQRRFRTGQSDSGR
jgi:hypothetical protein